MPTSMSLEELAELVHIEPAKLREWAEAGLLDPRGEGRFDDLDLLRLMTIKEYEALGKSMDELAAAISAGEVEPFLGEYIYPRGAQLTLAEAAERSGVDPELLRDLRTALGWIRPGFLEADLRVLEAFNAIAAAGMPREALLEGARAFGDTLRRLAEAEIRLVHVHIHERLVDEGLPEDEVARRIHVLQEAALPLLDTLVERVHHEHLLQASIEDAFVHLVDTEAPAGRGSVDATIVFIDVESFTELTETRGDQAAVDAMSHVDSLIREVVIDHDGKVVKHIGDALMLAFRRPADAVAFAAVLQRVTREDAETPGLRIGMHCGSTIYRGGDYLGTTVNLASRVTSTATAGEIVLTKDVADKLEDGAPVEPVGLRMLRGAERPMQLYRLRREEARRDPACGRMVNTPAARLQQEDGELWFCSEQCLRDYLATPRAAA